MANKDDLKKVQKTAEEIAEMLRNYVTPERYQQFLVDNQKNIERIAAGQVTEPMIFNNRNTGEEYTARVQGVLASTDENRRFVKLDCIYKQESLFIAPTIKLGGSKVSFTEEQIMQLKSVNRLDELVTNDAENSYFVAVDPELNRLTFSNADKVNIPSKLHGVDLSSQQREDLRQGKIITYQRASPFSNDEVKRGDILVLNAYYDPTLRTIRSSNVIDENGSKTVISASLPKAVEKSQSGKVIKSKSLDKVEKIVKTPVKKKATNVKAQTKSM